MSAGGGYQQSESEQSSSSNTGFLGPEKAAASPYAFETLKGLVGPAVKRLFSPTPAYTLDENGLFPQQRGLFDTAVNQAFSRASASAGARGQRSPENLAGIAGSAAMNVGPEFAPLVGQQVKEAALLPDVVQSQRLSDALNILQLIIGGLGGSSQSLGSSNAFGFSLFGGAPAKPSDRRLKSNIMRLGTHPLGIGIYEYDIAGLREIGVMADELEAVRPDAVTVINGYRHVYYDRIGGRPTRTHALTH